MKYIKRAKICIFLLLLVVFNIATFCFSVNPVYANSPILTISALDKTYCFYEYETSVYNGRRYLNDLENIIDKIYLDTLVNPVNSTLSFSKSNFETPFTITKSSDGVCIDKEKLKKDVDLALNDNVNFIKCSTVTILPKTSTENNENLTFLRGEFTTNYYTSVDGRKTNISLAIKRLNGTIIKSEEIFSFNKTVGERNEKNGYQTAKIILNGEYVDGVGGGVCQVSTTLYNALLLSNLKVIEHHAHSLMVNYVEPSFDAMVSGTSLDLKFKNDTANPIYITAKADGNNLTFRIYGEKHPYQIQRISKITQTITPSPCEYIESDTLYQGEQSIIQNEKQGVKSQGFLSYYKNGKKINDVFIRNDYYKPISRKILVGNKQKIENDDEQKTG